MLGHRMGKKSYILARCGNSPRWPTWPNSSSKGSCQVALAVQRCTWCQKIGFVHVLKICTWGSNVLVYLGFIGVGEFMEIIGEAKDKQKWRFFHNQHRNDILFHIKRMLEGKENYGRVEMGIKMLWEAQERLDPFRKGWKKRIWDQFQMTFSEKIQKSRSNIKIQIKSKKK